MPRQNFVIPSTLDLLTHDVIARVIESVPSDWKWKTGRLFVPKSFLREGGVLVSTKLVFSSSIHSMVQGMTVSDVQCPPDTFGLVVEGKLPAQVWFGNGAFTQSEVLSLDQTTKFAIHYMRKGYYGSLTYQYDGDSSLSDDSHYHHCCEICIPEYVSEKVQFSVEWGADARNGRHIPILTVCKQLGLVELV